MNSEIDQLNNTRAGSYINLNNYTSLANSYITQNDGYVYMNNQAYPNQKIMVPVFDSNNVNIAYPRLDPNGATFQTSSIYVKKGLKIYRSDGSTAGVAWFYPLVN